MTDSPTQTVALDHSNHSASLPQAARLQELEEKKSAFKTLKKQKAEVARQFKDFPSGSVEQDNLKKQMQQVSTALNQIESDIKALEQSLKEPVADTQTIESLQPPLFLIPQQLFSDPFEIRELKLDEQHQWFAFLAEFKHTTAYHQPAWAALIEKSFQQPTRIWVALNHQQKIIGGLPLTFFASRLFGKFAVAIPYVNYGGAITAYIDVARALLKHLPGICHEHLLSHIEVRTMQAGLAQEASNKKASMILQLPENEIQLDKNLGAKVRAQFNKGDDYQLEIKFGKGELLNDFYRVFATNMRDLGTPVYSKEWFNNIINHADVDGHIAVTYHKNKPVSCAFLVGYAGMLEIPWASTLQSANALNANMWMYRKILGFAIQQQYQFFDFGRSTQDAGTYKFKKQWGSQAYVHYWYSFTADGNTKAPELNPDNPKFKLMIAVWKRLPVWLTRLIGPPIIKNIP